MQPDNWGDGMNIIQGPSSDDMIGLYKMAQEPLEHVRATTSLPRQENGLYADLEALLGLWELELTTDGRTLDDWDAGYEAGLFGCGNELKKVLDKHRQM